MLSCGHILADMSLKRWEDTLWQKRINEVVGYDEHLFEVKNDSKNLPYNF